MVRIEKLSPLFVGLAFIIFHNCAKNMGITIDMAVDIGIIVVLVILVVFIIITLLTLSKKTTDIIIDFGYKVPIYQKVILTLSYMDFAIT